jgi:hypothetical protein
VGSMPNTYMNPTEPPQILGGTGIGFAVRRVMPAVSLTWTGTLRYVETGVIKRNY